jgi:hypothetical protein
MLMRLALGVEPTGGLLTQPTAVVAWEWLVGYVPIAVALAITSHIPGRPWGLGDGAEDLQRHLDSSTL